MSTNDVNTSEETEMAECDGEKVVTMMDVLQEQQEFEEDANAVLGGSDDKNCTYSKGYIKRQAVYACMTCCAEAKTDPTKRAGVCLACSLSCHENHELIELYLKRNFRCDCGNQKFNSNPCQFTQNKNDLNKDNKYNQNYSGLYCICNRPYPDPDSSVEDEMIQCIICEDWLHAKHLDAVVPASDQYSEMICKGCMDNNEFLHDYSDLAVKVENSSVDVESMDNSISNGLSDDVKMSNESADQEIMKEKDVVVKEKTECEKVVENENDQIASINKLETDKTTDIEQPHNDKLTMESSSSTKDDKEDSDNKISEDTSIESNEPSTNSNNILQVSEEKVCLNNLSASPKGEQTQEVTLAINSENDKDMENNENMADEDCKKLETEKQAEELTISGKETSNSTTLSEKESKKVDFDEPIKQTESTVELTDKSEVKTNITEELENKNVSNNPDLEENELKTMEISEVSKCASKVEHQDAQVDQESMSEPVKVSTEGIINTKFDVSKNIIETNDMTKEDKEEKEIEETKVNDASQSNIPEKDNGTFDKTLTNSNENKRKLSIDDVKHDVVLKKSKVNEVKCMRPQGASRCLKGATFWPSNFRQKLCTCNECLTMYKDLSVLFLIDLEDTVSAYEKLGMEKAEGSPSTQYEKGLQALSSLDRVQQINALTEYNKMRDKLLDFLKSFKDRKEIVKEEDIKAFFAGMKPKREPDGVYFCR